MNASKLIRGSNTSHILSSFHSSNSFIRYDDDMYSIMDSRVPENVETLSTGLRLVLDEVFVNIVWQADKKRDKLQDLLKVYMLREGILSNFEKMELLLIADFLLYNLIFAKEELNLDDKKTSILINLMWLLLKNKNPAYDPPDINENILSGKNIDNEKSKKDKEFAQKTVEDDLELFKVNLLNHAVDNRPTQIRYFSLTQIKRILEYIHKAYIDKFKLYKYVFANKKQNEEIRMTVDISQPTPVPPLKDALFMGYEFQPIVDEDEDEREYMMTQSVHIQKLSVIRSEEKDLESDSKIISRIASAKHVIKEEVDPTLKVIEEKIEEVKGNFEEELEENDKAFDERMVNKPGKKKKR